jgi:hypothetical protein
MVSLNKRGELDDTIYEKRDVEVNNDEDNETKSSPETSKSKRVKKTVESIIDENKVELRDDDVDVKKLRSLKRRDDIDDEYNSLAKNENEMEIKNNKKRNQISEDDLN